MSQVLAPKETDRASSTDDPANMIHAFCWCDESIAICGADLSDYKEVLSPDVEAECIVCDDLEDRPCPRCGE